MKTVILCGGFGTRIREWTEEIPKPLVEVGGKPILWHVMQIYAQFGYTDFVLCLGYLGEKIPAYFAKNPEPDWNIEFVDTGENTETGGRIKLIQQYVDDHSFFATYGDGLANIDLQALLAFHQKQNQQPDQPQAVATLTAVNPYSQFGLLELGEGDKIKAFKEKPRLDKWINGGFFVFEPAIFDYLDENSVLERTPFETLAAAGKISAYKHHGFWKCMDTFKDAVELDRMLKSGEFSNHLY